MYETYRMLGREHEADLEREAQKWQRAAEARGPRRHRAPARVILRQRKSIYFALGRVTAFVGRIARVEA